MNNTTKTVCIADVHYSGTESDRSNLVSGLEALKRLFPDYSALCVTGDLTDNGFECEYKEAVKLIKDGMPEGAVFQAAMGNHEWYRHGWGVSISKNPGFKELYQELFVACTGSLIEDERKVGNTVLLAVSPDDEGDEIASREAFLMSRITKAEEQNADAVILSVHKAIAGTVSSSWDYQNNSGDFLCQKWSRGFLDFLSHKKRVIYVSGHTHDYIRDNPPFYKGRGLVCVQTGFFAGTPSECVVLESGSDGCLLHCVNLSAGIVTENIRLMSGSDVEE